MPSETPSHHSTDFPALVLGVYGEDLAVGARAAIFGRATLGLAEELVSRGARLVHVYDTDPARLAEATANRRDRSIFYGALSDSGDVGVRDGAFDFVIVPDLSFVDDHAALLALVRRLLAPSGAALIASPNLEASTPLIPISAPRSALGYYELYEAVAEHFTSVRMLGQAPFVGYAVAEFSVEDPEPTIDTSLAEADGKEPDWFVVLASERNVRLDPFALIELPKNADIDAPSVWPVRRSQPSLEGTAPPASETSGTVLVDILEAEREAALESLRQKEQVVKDERLRADVANQELGGCKEELALLRERCKAAERRRDDDEKRRAALELELEEARKSPELAAARAHVQGLEAASREIAEQHEREVVRLETELRNRGREVQEFRAEVDRREALVREILATSLAPPAEPSTADESQASNGHEGVIADLSARLDRLASDAATREADLQAAKWKIAQLERQLTGER